MRRALRSRSIKRTRHRTPGGKNIVAFRKKRPGYAQCGNCGAKMVRKRLRATGMRKLAKTRKRPNRPYPELCPRCMREEIRQRVK